MALQSWKCTECNKTFKVGEWVCMDGVSQHKVASKMYRACDPPQDIGYKDTKGTPLDASSFGETVVCNIPPSKRIINEAGEISYQGGGSITFVRGRFSTSNPEVQYWLDMRPEYNRTEDDWSATWLSKDQQLDLVRDKLEKERMRLENERNELLAATKARVGA